MLVYTCTQMCATAGPGFRSEGGAMGSPDKHRMRTPRSLTAVTALLSVAALTACGGGDDAAASGDATGGGDLFPITLRADIYYTGAFMPFLAGKDAGIFEDHGIDLRLEPGKGSAT